MLENINFQPFEFFFCKNRESRNGSFVSMVRKKRVYAFKDLLLTNVLLLFMKKQDQILISGERAVKGAERVSLRKGGAF